MGKPGGGRRISEKLVREQGGSLEGIVLGSFKLNGGGSLKGVLLGSLR